MEEIDTDEFKSVLPNNSCPNCGSIGVLIYHCQIDTCGEKFCNNCNPDAYAIWPFIHNVSETRELDEFHVREYGDQAMEILKGTDMGAESIDIAIYEVFSLDDMKLLDEEGPFCATCFSKEFEFVVGRIRKHIDSEIILDRNITAGLEKIEYLRALEDEMRLGAETLFEKELEEKNSEFMGLNRLEFWRVSRMFSGRWLTFHIALILALPILIWKYIGFGEWYLESLTPTGEVITGVVMVYTIPAIFVLGDCLRSMKLMWSSDERFGNIKREYLEMKQKPGFGRYNPRELDFSTKEEKWFLARYKINDIAIDRMEFYRSHRILDHNHPKHCWHHERNASELGPFTEHRLESDIYRTLSKSKKEQLETIEKEIYLYEKFIDCLRP